MISVPEAAEMLGISPARIRKLIAEGKLHATRVGSRWLIAEEDIVSRRLTAPKGGRPAKTEDCHRTLTETTGNLSELYPDEHALYLACKKAFSVMHAIPAGLPATDKPEIDFYMALSDFFLQERQRELVRRGVF